MVKTGQKENDEALAQKHNPRSLDGHRRPCRLPGKPLPYRIVDSSFTLISTLACNLTEAPVTLE
jgi:hypothetical protein